MAPYGGWTLVFLNNLSDGFKGRMVTGWQWIDGRCYYFETGTNGQGSLYMGGKTPDGYLVNADGQWIDKNGEIHVSVNKGFKTKERVSKGKHRENEI